MKQNNYFQRMLSALVLLMASSLSWAYDFKAENADGVTIYYNLINNGTEAEVTYKDDVSASYSGDLSIPSTVTYDGKTLSVTSIGDNAFWFCGRLTSITIPESVTSIGDMAFSYCSLTSVTIPESVTSIGDWAFYDCSSLTSVHIGNGVTSIGESAFRDCSGLTSITVDKDNPAYDSRGNCNAIIETTTNTLHTGCRNTIIPESVTSIGNYAFSYRPGLTSVTIPESVTSIGHGAFEKCYNLTSVIIGKSVVSIGERTFADCRYLISIVVNAENPVYDSRDDSNAIIETASNTLVQGCNGTVIPESVTSIGDYAFYGCFRLTSITIPESVTSIGEEAFRDCIWLTSVYSLIKNPFSIASYVFSGIARDATLYVPQGTKNRYEATEGWPDNFKEIVEFNATSISEVNPGQSAEGVAVYGLNGTKVNVKNGDLKSLPRGIYVVNGKKMLVE